ncbi:unnamed protein product [Calypogeia fissa]
MSAAELESNKLNAFGRVNVTDPFLNCDGEGMTLFPEWNEEACIPQGVEHGPNSISRDEISERRMTALVVSFQECLRRIQETRRRTIGPLPVPYKESTKAPWGLAKTIEEHMDERVEWLLDTIAFWASTRTDLNNTTTKTIEEHMSASRNEKIDLLRKNGEELQQKVSSQNSFLNFDKLQTDPLVNVTDSFWSFYGEGITRLPELNEEACTTKEDEHAYGPSLSWIDESFERYRSASLARIEEVHGGEEPEPFDGAESNATMARRRELLLLVESFKKSSKVCWRSLAEDMQNEITKTIKKHASESTQEKINSLRKDGEELLKKVSSQDYFLNFEKLQTVPSFCDAESCLRFLLDNLQSIAERLWHRHYGQQDLVLSTLSMVIDKMRTVVGKLGTTREWMSEKLKTLVKGLTSQEGVVERQLQKCASSLSAVVVPPILEQHGEKFISVDSFTSWYSSLIL